MEPYKIKNGRKIPCHINITSKEKTLLGNWKNILDYSDFKGKSYYYPMDDTAGKLVGVIRAIKDGILDGKDTGVNGLTEIHDEIGKKTEDAHYDFFTPKKTAKTLGDLINKENKDGEEVLEIGTGLGRILQHIENGVGIEYNYNYRAIAKHWIGLNVFQKDITRDKMEKKYKYLCCNPPFGAEINKYLFQFIKDNMTDDFIGFVLLQNDYEKHLKDFDILDKIEVKEKFANTSIKTAIYKIRFKKLG